jgi:hypothetical protein
LIFVKVGWYNELVGPKFTLDFAPATLAFVVISGPDTFEKCVLPYLQSELDKNPNAETNDPLDDAMVDAFSRVKQVWYTWLYFKGLFAVETHVARVRREI